MRSAHKRGLPGKFERKKQFYALAAKDNQGELHERIQSMFTADRKEGFRASPFKHIQTVNQGHGRIEVGNCWVTDDPEYLDYADTDKK